MHMQLLIYNLFILHPVTDWPIIQLEIFFKISKALSGLVPLMD